MQQPKSVYTPSLLIPRHVLKKISVEASAHPNTETGASLIGIETDASMIILGIIPDEVNIERYPGLFKAGGQYQVEVFRWYQQHWDMMRKNSRALENQIPWKPSIPIPEDYIPVELDRDLQYLGDWHKHPGAMTHLSGQDVHTIHDILADPAQNRLQLLSPLVTHIKYTIQNPLAEHEMRIDNFRMTWYYTSRESGNPVRIKPFPIANSNLPKLPPLSWHLSNYLRFTNEIEYLNNHGYNVQWKVLDVDNDSICELVLSINSISHPARYLVVTRWNYPSVAPQFYQYPENPAAKGEYLNLDGWSEESYLIDYLLFRKEGIPFERPMAESPISRRQKFFQFISIKSWSRRSWLSRKSDDPPASDVGAQ